MWRVVKHLFFKNPIGLLSGAILLMYVVVAIFAPFIAPPTPHRSPYEIPRDGFYIAPRPPNRGMAVWSFPVRDMDEILGRLEAAGIDLFAPPVEYTSPSLGHHEAVTVLDPSGFLVELFQTID